MRIIKKIIVVMLLLMAAAAAAALAYYFTVTGGSTLQEDKLAMSENFAEVFDVNGDKAAEIAFSGADKKIKIGELPQSAKNAFIAAEDKKFYRHHGLDYARILKATVKNIGAHAFKQGASTISQQLIKNTHLSNEKTLKRKLKEIKLTRELEKKFSKDEILETYLNTIYFGHSCYGIAGAADFYFGKNAQELTPGESAMLAAIIRSPNRYSPFVDPEKCMAARNGVLKKMRDLGYLSEAEYDAALAEPLPQKQDNSISSRSYLQCVAEELDNISALYSPYRAYGGIRIYTYMDAKLQNYAENLKTDADRSGKSIVVEDNKTYGIAAYYTSEGNIRRQPGSLFKPLAVYAPAIENDLISPCTPILDEKTNFGGYLPANYKDVYHGYVSARQALSESINIPAVKILSQMGVSESEKYLSDMGLKIREEDKNLSLALGGVSEGFTLQQLTGAYALFARGGIYAPPAFIRRIETSDGELLYERKIDGQRVFSEDTVFLVNDMLKDAAKSGTAKKLAALNLPLCAKTGTCGADKGNTDAYTIAYTGSHTVGVWLGNADNALTNITGGGLPCHYAMLLCRRLYGNAAPQPLPECTEIETAAIDRIAYEREHTVLLAAPDQPKKYTMLEYFRRSALPKTMSTTFSAPKIEAEIRCKNDTVYIDVCQAEYYNILIERENNGKIQTIYDGKASPCQDSAVRKNEKYSYRITPYFIDDAGEKIIGDTLRLPAVYIRSTPAQNDRREDYGRWWEACRA